MTWDACTQDPHEWVRFIECHPGIAGYLQFAGALLAVLVAIYISRSDIRARAADARQTRARTAVARAAALLPAVLQVKRQLEFITEFAPATGQDFGLELAMLDSPAALKHQLLPTVPWSEIVPELDAFDVGAILNVSRLFNAVDSWNRFVSKYLSDARKMDGEARGYYIEVADKKHTEMTALVLQTKRDLEKMIDLGDD